MTRDYVERVRAHLADRASEATDPRVTVGARALLVEVDHPDHGRLAGLAHRPDGDRVEAWPSSVQDLCRLATAPSPLDRAAGIAALNALSAPEMEWRTGDPMAALPSGIDVVATVGLFGPALGKFDDVTVRVVEREPQEEVAAPPGVTVEIYPPGDCGAAFADADVCFLTGSAILYGGFERYLDALAAAGVSPVILVGATASHWPDPAFEAGVDAVAGARVDDPDRVRERVAAGDCGTDLHDHGVAKVYVAGDAGALELADGRASGEPQ